MTINIIAAFACAMLLGGCSLFGHQGVEIAPYDVERTDGAFELRSYDALVVVKTRAAGDYDSMSEVAFNRLFDYIMGANDGGKKIAMTAPVVMEKKSGKKIPMTAPVLMERTDMQSQSSEWSMAFVLPRDIKFENAPRPTDPTVFLEKMPPHRVAVIRFSGLLNDRNIEKNTAALRAWVAARGYKNLGDPVVAGYDPPWTLPPFRRNEIHQKVE